MDIKKYMRLTGVGEEHYDNIVKSMKLAKDNAFKLHLYSFTAPLVLLFLVPFMKWEDNKVTDLLQRNPFKWLHKYWKGLEQFLDKYDNNISMNGDNLRWIEDPNGVLYDGIRYSYEEAPLEDTPEERAKCYYAKGHHRRSKYARYVWLGLRNRASKYALDIGKELSRDKFPDKYIYRDGKGTVIELWTLDDWWQITTSEPFLKYFKKKTNMGLKINIFDTDLREKAIIVHKPFAYVRDSD